MDGTEAMLRVEEVLSAKANKKKKSLCIFNLGVMFFFFLILLFSSGVLQSPARLLIDRPSGFPEGLCCNSPAWVSPLLV